MFELNYCVTLDKLLIFLRPHYSILMMSATYLSGFFFKKKGEGLPWWRRG